jgi:hypothetical protein
LPEVGDCLIGKTIELSGRSVKLDLVIETSAIELLNPRQELGELIGWEFRDGLFQIFDGHGVRIAYFRPEEHGSGATSRPDRAINVMLRFRLRPTPYRKAAR